MTKITVKVMLMKLRKSFSLSISFSLKFKNVSQLAVTYSIPDVCKLLQILIATLAIHRVLKEATQEHTETLFLLAAFKLPVKIKNTQRNQTSRRMSVK